MTLQRSPDRSDAPTPARRCGTPNRRLPFFPSATAVARSAPSDIADMLRQGRDACLFGGGFPAVQRRGWLPRTAEVAVGGVQSWLRRRGVRMYVVRTIY